MRAAVCVFPAQAAFCQGRRLKTHDMFRFSSSQLLTSIRSVIRRIAPAGQSGAQRLFRRDFTHIVSLMAGQQARAIVKRPAGIDETMCAAGLSPGVIQYSAEEFLTAQDSWLFPLFRPAFWRSKWTFGHYSDLSEASSRFSPLHWRSDCRKTSTEQDFQARRGEFFSPAAHLPHRTGRRPTRGVFSGSHNPAVPAFEVPHFLPLAAVRASECF